MIEPTSRVVRRINKFTYVNSFVPFKFPQNQFKLV